MADGDRLTAGSAAQGNITTSEQIPRFAPFCLGAAIACCGLLIGTVWWTGAVPQIAFGHDMMVLLDGGWKWKWGYTPHADFYSPFGALTFLLVAVGIDLSGSQLHAIPAATCIVASLALLLAVYSSFTRLHPLIALAATIVIVAATVAPHELRFGSDVWSYAAIYNRWAYPLLGLAMLIMAVRPSGRRRWMDWADGFIVGSCTVLLIFLKISYGLVALGLIAGFAPIRRRERPYWLGVFISASTWILVFGVLLDWSFPNLLDDMRIAAGARQGLGPMELARWIWTLRGELLAMSLLGVIWCATGVLTGRQTLLRRGLESGWILSGFAGSAAAILMTNSPLGSLNETLIVQLGALVMLAGIVRDLRDGGTWSVRWLSPGGALIAAASLTLLLVLPTTARNVKSVVTAAEAKRAGASLAQAEVFQAGPLDDLQIAAFGGDPPLPTTYVGKVMDGIRLLNRIGRADDTVAALDFSNPFNVARGVPPSRTAPTAWQLGFVYTRRSAPSADRVFNGRDVIMIAKRFGDGNQANLVVLRQLYGSYLDKHYRIAGESQQWQALVPR